MFILYFQLGQNEIFCKAKAPRAEIQNMKTDNCELLGSGEAG